MALARTVFELIIAALVVWHVSTTLATAKVFGPFRMWICPKGSGRGLCGAERARAWLYELVSCQFCISHYVALAYMVFWRPAMVATGNAVVNFTITWFSVVAVSSIIARACQKREPAMPRNVSAALEQYLRSRRRRPSPADFESLLLPSRKVEEGTVLHT